MERAEKIVFDELMEAFKQIEKSQKSIANINSNFTIENLIESNVGGNNNLDEIFLRSIKAKWIDTHRDCIKINQDKILSFIDKKIIDRAAESFKE